MNNEDMRGQPNTEKFLEIDAMVSRTNVSPEKWTIKTSERGVKEIEFYASLVKRLGILEIKTANIPWLGDHYEFHISARTFWIKIYSEYSSASFTTNDLYLSDFRDAASATISPEK